MLLIDHYVAESDIHGLGVFSAQSVKRDDLTWEFNPVIDREIPREKLSDLPDHVVEKIYKHAWYHPENNCFWLAADGDYFMNHSDMPTMEVRGHSFVAARDLVFGDELTCDYRVVKVFDFDPSAVERDQQRLRSVGAG